VAFNGFGTYVLPAGNPVVTGTPITSVWANTTLDDVSAALTNCITRNGQSPATANIPMGSFKITGIGAAVVAGDAVRYEQIPFLNGTALPVASGGTGAATLAANSVLLGNGTSALQAVAPSTSGNVLTSDGTTWNSTARVVELPTQTGQSGKLLTTNGTIPAWTAPVQELPAQAGQLGKYLSTDGTTATWAAVMSPSITLFNSLNFGGL